MGHTYDPASRLATVTSGANTATYSYLPDSSLVGTLTFRRGGDLSLTTAKTYDRLNRLASTVNQSAAPALPPVSHAYSYNAANQRTRATRADDSYWSYGYDALGQVASGREFLADATAVPGHDYAWTYDDIGNRRTATANTLVSTYAANGLNQYVQRTVPGVIDVTGAAAPGTTVTVALDGGIPQPVTRQGETFFKQLPVENTAGPRHAQLTITGVKNLVGPLGEDAVTSINRATLVPASPEAFAYDDDGNLTADGRWTYTWDAENRLVALETAPAAVAAGAPRRKLEFAYDGQSRRHAKKVSNWSGGAWVLASHHRYLYDGWNMLAELDALNSHAVVRTYVWGTDLSGSPQGAGGVGGLLATTHRTPAVTDHFAAFDGNGNLSALVSAADGSLTATYDYNAFGETVLAEGALGQANPFRFSGKFNDDESGLLYYGYRFYNPGTGRWLNRDPIEEQGGENIYAFVDNDGANSVDYLGLWTTPAHNLIINDWLPVSYENLDGGCCGKINVRDLFKGASARLDGFVGIRGLRWLPNLNPFSSKSFYRQQSAKHSAEHAMSYPGQDTEGPDSAHAQYEQFVAQKIAAAKTILASLPADGPARCKAIKRAIQELGYAFHAVSDEHSPQHHGSQEWKGLKNAMLHPRQTSAHAKGEGPDVWASLPYVRKALAIGDLNRRIGGTLSDAMNAFGK